MELTKIEVTDEAKELIQKLTEETDQAIRKIDPEMIEALKWVDISPHASVDAPSLWRLETKVEWVSTAKVQFRWLDEVKTFTGAGLTTDLSTMHLRDKIREFAMNLRAKQDGK